jgi:hypothetical protein
MRTTVTRNAVITCNGASDALQDEWLRDVLEIRRANRAELYDISPRMERPDETPAARSELARHSRDERGEGSLACAPSFSKCVPTAERVEAAAIQPASVA